MLHFLDIIILLLVVLFIFNRLKNVLGTRPEGTKATPLSEESAAKIFDIIMAENERNAKRQAQDITPQAEKSPLQQEMDKIPGFNPDAFLNGAKRAFEIIVTAFAKGDVETLEGLVSPKLVKKFQDVLRQRQADGITAETDLIGFTETAIISVKIGKNDIAKITVKFVSEQVNLLKNAKDEIIEGDENFVQNITDVWTFERCLTSSNPNWLLTSTKK